MNPFSNLRTIDDFRRADEEFQMRKAESEAKTQYMQNQSQAAKKGQNLPSSIQIDNEIATRLKAGDVDGANRLFMVHRSGAYGVNTFGDQPAFTAPVQPQEDWQNPDAMPNITQENQPPSYTPKPATPAAGIADVLAANAAKKKGAESDAANQSDLTYKPKITEANAVADAAGKKTAEINTKAASAPNNLMLLDEADKLLPNASNGMLSSMGTRVVNAFGKSTDASKANRRLSVLSASLTAGVPKMSGPTSDRDMMEYKTAAGDLANPEIPFEDRQAASATIRALQKKYEDAAQPISNATPNESFNEMPIDQAPAIVQGKGNIKVGKPDMSISPQDPRIAAARAAGYSEQEITNYLGGR